MSPKKRPRPDLMIILLVTTTLLTIGMAEGISRLAFTYHHNFPNRVDPAVLDPYEMIDPNNTSNWRLRPGVSLTLDEYLRHKEEQGSTLAENQIKAIAAKYGIPHDEEIFRINKEGYKGPELQEAHEKVRILTIGDSCTFGSLLDRFAYPRAIETYLKTLNLNVEVVNGGVEGYTPRHVLFRIEEFKALKPDIVTIYTGWNAIYTFDALRGQRWFQTPLLFSAVWNRLHTMIVGRQTAALAAYQKKKTPDFNSDEVKNLSGYHPLFIEDVENIIRGMKGAGSNVVLVTLPGLYVMNEMPTERALEMGHLPEYTNNPFVLAKITEIYNIELRKVAKRENVYVIDLEQWSNETLRPRDAYFRDSVHLTEEGQQLIGRYIGEKLTNFYPSLLTGTPQEIKSGKQSPGI